MLENISARDILDLIILINIVFVAVVVLFERRNPTATLVWLLLLVFVPLLGFILYLLLGQDLRKKKLFYLKKEEEKHIDHLISQQDRELHSNQLVFKDPHIGSYRDIIHLHLKSDQALFTQDNQVEIFTEGEQLFQAMMKSIGQASHYIHMEYYIIRDDSLGRAIVDLLSHKAREGVEVKLLYDGMGCIRLPRGFFRPLQEAGGEVASFFPPFVPYINVRIDYRNHRKICLVDGQEGYVGGFNVGNEYRGLSKKFGRWRDTHLRIQGSALDGLQKRFLMDWRFASHQKDFKVMDEKYFPSRPAVGESGLQIVSSGPDAPWSSIRNGYLKMIGRAQKNIYIQTPYFVPDESVLEALKVAALSGVDVRIMIPRKKDHPFVHWAALSYIGELLEAGARCYCYEDGFLHSKVVTTDGFFSSVGTANLDVRSFRLNFEINAFIYDARVTQYLEKHFDRDLSNCTEITMEQYCQRPTRVKAKEAFSRLLSPLL